MTPKPKFTREEIVITALELVSEKGMSALTPRDLGAKLGSTTIIYKTLKIFMSV